MEISLKDIQKKGFSILHGLWGNSSRFKSMIGLNGSEGLGENSIGYLAYPNEGGLKNIIPDRQFFNYDQFIHQNSIPIFDIAYKTSGDLEQSYSKSDYLKKVLRIKELLLAGEVYQINFALRFKKAFSGEPYALFQKLHELNPVDFQAYINAGDFQIISSSPERFFKVSDGKIMTQPIKGTARKTGSAKKDPNLKYLLESKKERAELDMITDLERNDIGKICKYGSLKVKVERGVLELPNIWHCYSQVEGELPDNISFEEVVQAMLPSGSITGCPKKRAMEYIAELEGLPRNVYTGAIGYTIAIPNDQFPMTNKGQVSGVSCQIFEADFNIAIRTILIKDGYLEFWAGGGIVADSDPEKEYAECMLKAEKFLDVI